MKSPDIVLHYLQTEILRKLSLSPKLRFNNLLIEGVESEHMNYHLKKLIEYGFVEKSAEYYFLSDTGKDYVNTMDDEVNEVEKQPKTSVLLRAIRINKENGNIEHLLSKRLKHPYYGKIGRLTGKVRFGETLEEAAQRELFEETGLIAGFIKLEEIYHKMRYKQNNEFVQDVIFYTFFMKDLKGNFVNKTSSQENLWLSQADLASKKDLDLFEGLTLDNNTQAHQLTFVESVAVASGY